MLRFLLKRLLAGFFVLLGVVILIFSIFLLIHVDPAQLTLGQRADQASREAVTKKLGLDLPWHQRLIRYTGDLSPVWVYARHSERKDELQFHEILNLPGNRVLAVKAPYLGRSFQSDRKVAPVIFAALIRTAVLAFLALLLAVLFGVAMGVIAALNKGKWPDQALVSISAIGVSVPSYFSAIVFSFVFGYLLREYTHLNMTGSLYDLQGQLQLKNLILPSVALGIRPIAVLTQLTRSAMLEVLSADYIRTARAKGLSPFRTVMKHALRNALNPVVTSISGWFASLLAGAYFVEVIFNYKGLGFLTVQAVESYDFPLMMGAVLLGALFFVLINIAVDLIYGLLDPRVRLAA